MHPNIRIVVNPGGNVSIARKNSENRNTTERRIKDEFARMAAHYNIQLPATLKNAIIKKTRNNLNHIHPLPGKSIRFEIAKFIYNKGGNVPTPAILTYDRYLQNLMRNALQNGAPPYIVRNIRNFQNAHKLKVLSL